jgi:general stress protein YciG
MTNKKPKPRGFAAMSPAQRKAIASKGGRAVQRKGRAHRWTREEAVAAGRKGGLASQGGGSRFDSESGAKAARKRRRR